MIAAFYLHCTFKDKRGKMAPGSLRLSNDNFNLHTGDNTKRIYEDKIFTDVTLVSDDLTSFRAHRTVLSGASSVFRKLLLLHQEANSVLYLKGLQMVELKAMLDFIYLGETKVEAESIPAFLKHASELQIRDLSADVFLDHQNHESPNRHNLRKDLNSSNFMKAPVNDTNFESDKSLKSDISEHCAVTQIVNENPKASVNSPIEEDDDHLQFEEIKHEISEEDVSRITEDDTIHIPLFEPDPGNVDVFWEKNAKSNPMGVLYTHQMKYKWYRQQHSKDGNIRYRFCRSSILNIKRSF